MRVLASSGEIGRDAQLVLLTDVLALETEERSRISVLSEWQVRKFPVRGVCWIFITSLDISISFFPRSFF